MYSSIYLSLQMQQDLSFAILGGEVLVGHVEGSSGGGYEHLSCLDGEGYVVDVWV